MAQPLPLKEEQVVLDRLIKSLAQSTLRERTFHETYYSHMLTTPSYKEGTLVSHPPNRLEKHVQVPIEESFIVDGDSLLYKNPSREISHTFSLQEYPALATFIVGLRALFNGDTEQLRQVFVVSISGTLDAWELDLSPRIQTDEDGVDCIRLAGERTYLRTIVIHETNGDRSELQLDRQVP
ncbi:MAG: outer membrane lipoprotein carrier protein LolA [Nitrospirales bacterium]|nr:MAG: outer membrane lipoprotein carrier protein LolA [Nitrospirales bacterium]